MKKGVLSVAGFGCDVSFSSGIKEHRKDICSKDVELFSIGDGESKLSFADITDAISETLKAHENPTIMFEAHGQAGGGGVVFHKEKKIFTSQDIIKYIKEKAIHNSVVDCAFLTCHGGSAFKDLVGLPRNSAMVALCPADGLMSSFSNNSFHSAIGTSDGDFSLVEIFKQYIRESRSMTSNPMIGVSKKGILEIPCKGFNPLKGQGISFERRLELINQISNIDR